MILFLYLKNEVTRKCHPLSEWGYFLGPKGLSHWPETTQYLVRTGYAFANWV